MGAKALLASILCMTLPETSGLPTAEIMDSEEGAELGIQNVAMDDMVLSDEKEKDKGDEKSVVKNLKEEKLNETKEKYEEESKNETDEENHNDETEKDGEEGKSEKTEPVNDDVMGSHVNLVDNTAF